MSNYEADPKKLENFTQAEEDKIFVGRRDLVKQLPSILQTDTNKRFLRTTLDQLFSSGSTETLDTYWGRITGKDYINDQDLFAPETKADRLNYQLAQGFSIKNGLETESANTYVSILNTLEKFGAPEGKYDQMFSDPGYTLDLPINIDMFVNYKNYYWFMDDIPTCVITPTAQDPIEIDNITLLSNYTTPVLDNGKTLEFVNGMRVIFSGSNVTSTSGDYVVGATYFVEGVGTENIKFVLAVDENNIVKFKHLQHYTPRLPSDWDADSWDSEPWDYSEFKLPTKEYVVMDRSSNDLNPWCRANQWFSIYAIRNTVEYNDLALEDYQSSQFRAQRPIIEFFPNIELYDSGWNFIDNIDHVITGVDPAIDIIGQSQYLNAKLGLEDGDLVLFLNSGSYSNNIYTVSGTATNNVQLTLATAASGLSVGDKILIEHGPDNITGRVGYPGIELWWTGTEWRYGQQKIFRGDAPRFKLYDDQGVDLANYTDTDYDGSMVFNYVYNTAGVIDPELGFAPRYVESNNNNDLDFETPIVGKRYNTDLGEASAREINGYYYFKDRILNEYHNAWAYIRENQRVPYIITHIATANESVEIDLGTTTLEHSTKFNLLHRSNNYIFVSTTEYDQIAHGETNGFLIAKYDTDYTIQQHIADANDYIEFVDPFGNVNSDIVVTTSGNTITLRINSAYPYSTVRYQSVTTTNTNGRIYLSDVNQKRLIVKQNGNVLTENNDYTVVGNKVLITDPAKEDDVFELEYISNEQVINGIYDVAPTFKYNALNESFNTVSFSNMFKHYQNQLLTMPGFDGNVFGENNYHKTARVVNYGGTIRQQIHSPAKMSYMMSRTETNPLNNIKRVGIDYENFKNYFKNKVQQVWETYSDLTVREVVNIALSEIHIGKNNTFQYARSDMVYYDNFQSQNISVNTNNKIFSLDLIKNKFGDMKNHIYVYVHQFNGASYTWKLLQPGVDYTLEVNQLTLNQSLTRNGANDPATISVYGVRVGDYSFTPPSAVKLGFTVRHQVEIVNGVLIGHDGSRHECNNTEFYDTASANFDIVTACLLDLETRISSGLVDAHDSTIDIQRYLPSPHYPTAFNWEDCRYRLDDWYNRWATRNNVTGFNDANYYDVNDKFTWNYSSVSPYIGGWQGIYNYYFGTARPHTHPWEMLGHKVKPIWWDSTYSWTDPAKRSALIAALKIGKTGQSDVVVLHYSCHNYDWDNNTLVTTTGVLNDPITAGVVTTPSNVDASKDFQFNDWGPYEDQWRNTSQYKFALVELFLKLKPFRTFERYWRMNFIQRRDNLANKFSQIVESDNNRRTILDNVNLHNQLTEKNIIRYVSVANGGSGYNNSTIASSYVTNGGAPTFSTVVNGGAVQAIAVDSYAAVYGDDVVMTISGGVGSSGANAIGVTRNITPNFMGLQTIIVNNAKTYNITQEDLKEDLKNLRAELMLHVGGYTDKNILNISLDSSYQKGRVSVPKNDFSIVLTKSAPFISQFYSGIKVTRGDNGYTVTGFNQNDRTFRIIPPSTGGASFTETIGNSSVLRFRNFKNTTEQYTYGHTFLKRQELYNFAIGLAEYYESLGFRVRQGWRADAIALIEWSLKDDGTTFFANGIPNNTLTFEQGVVGFVDNIGYNYDGTANILDSNMKPIKPDQLLVMRNDTDTTLETKDTSKKIYGIDINVVEYEHVITLNNLTQFDDITFDPRFGIQHTRVKLEGERTRNWNGRIEAPGYIVRNNGIIGNLETSTREVERDNINTESKTLNKATRETARFNTGYIQPTYLTNTFIEDNASYKFGKGQRNYNGTHTAINAFMRNKNLFGTNADHGVYEEWMIRLGDYGDTQRRNPIEVQIDYEKIKSSPQAIRLNQDYKTDNLFDLVIDIHPGSSSLVSGKIDNVPFELLPYEYQNNTSIEQDRLFSEFLPTAGLPLPRDANYKIQSIDDIEEVYDVTANYATIKNWSSNVAYHKGDQIRHEGKVLELNIDNTGLQVGTDDILVRGSQLYPIVPSNDTLILDGNTITFNKTQTITTFNAIQVPSTQSTPTAANNSTLILDGTTITFNKTITTVQYNPIVVTGSVGNPVVVGNTGEGLLFDGIFVDLAQTVSTSTNISALSGLFQSIDPHVVTSANSNTLATNRINAIENLRVAYTAVNGAAAWITWITDYFTGVNYPGGINISYLETEFASATPAYSVQIQALLQNDIDIVNAFSNQTYSITVSPTASAGGLSDISSTITDMNTGTYIQDFADYTIAGNTVLTSSTIAVINTTGPKNWSTADLIQEINNEMAIAGNTTIVASQDSTTGAIVITKTASQGDDTLILGSAGSNLEVGFPTSTTSYTATSSTVVSGATLNLVDIVQQINAANIGNVTAVAVGTSFEIQSTNQLLTIGQGTANTSTGIGQGTYNATTNVSTGLVDLQIYDIIDQINNANITGVVASNVNNNVIITSSNSTLIIGAGTANSAIGISSGTFNAEELVQNTFNASDWTQVTDPATSLKIWLLDNEGTRSLSTSRKVGYNLYQVFDFDFEIDECCAGNRTGDNALVSTINEHNLQEGDYVILINTTCTPSLDGIHQVSGVENPNYFYVDQFIEEKGYGGKMLVLRPTRFNNNTELNNTLINPGFYSSTSGKGWMPGMLAYVDNVIENGTATNLGAVYKAGINDTTNVIEFTKVRDQNQKVNNRLIKNAVVYDGETNEKIAQLEVYDPVKGIIPGVADKEIDIKQNTDSAIYTNTTDSSYVTNRVAFWGEEYVGTTWWDLSNAVYYDYEQGGWLDRQNNWGQLYPTSSIDIYEWTKSPVTPDQYESAVEAVTIIDGVTLSGVPYTSTGAFGETNYYWVENTEYNKDAGQEVTYYYFWVKFKTTTPGPDRRFSTTQLRNLILDPAGLDVDWVSACNNNAFLATNLDQYMAGGNSVLQINFANTDVDHHKEFILLAENDPATVIPEWLHMGLRDSIRGYDNNTVTEEFYTWTNTASFVQGDIVISPLGNYYRANINTIGVNPDVNTNNTWSRIYDTVYQGDGDIQPVNFITYSAPRMVPNVDLHPYNQLGQLIREQQSWIRDKIEARRVLINKLNSQIIDINLVDGVKSWSNTLRSTKIISGYTYTFSDYWDFANWIKPGFVLGLDMDRVVDYKGELALKPGTQGELALVRNSQDGDGVNREQIFQYNNGTWELQYKEKATIQFNDLLWDYQSLDFGWDAQNWDFNAWDQDPGAIIGDILDAVRADVFVGQYLPLYSDMWFTMLNYINSEQNNVDWAFKTTYIKAYLKHNLEKLDKLFVLERDQDVIDYINTVKPFHTKLRDTLTQRTADDSTTITAEEYDQRMMITERIDRYTGNDWACDLILDGGNNWAVGTHTDESPFTAQDGASGIEISTTGTTTDSITITIDGSNSDFEYVYHGNTFLQPSCMGWAPELYPVMLDEALEIWVYTNTSGSTVDANSRTFRMFYDSDGNNEATVVNSSTTLATNVAWNDDTIEVTDATQLVEPTPGQRGVVIVGNERVTYTHIVGNTLYNCARGTGNTAKVAHTAGDTVFEAGATTRIHMHPRLRNYGQNLRPAFNDFGKSITDATSTSPEAQFVYTNG